MYLENCVFFSLNLFMPVELLTLFNTKILNICAKRITVFATTYLNLFECFGKHLIKSEFLKRSGG